MAAAAVSISTSLLTNALVTATVIVATGEQPKVADDMKKTEVLIQQSLFAYVFERADKRVAEFSTLQAHADDRKARITLFEQVILKQIWPKMVDAFNADVKACIAVPITELSQPVITGSVAHGLSYHGGDIDLAWIFKTMAQLSYVQSLFARCFADDTKPNTGKSGTVVEKAVFFMGNGFDFKTKAGLPWVPFLLDGVKFDQTFRLESQHALIEQKAAEGNALLKNDEMKLAHIQMQHWLQMVKSDFAALNKTTAKEDKNKAGIEAAAALFEAVYMHNKKSILPDMKKLASLAA
jgi:hypothetical protein